MNLERGRRKRPHPTHLHSRPYAVGIWVRTRYGRHKRPHPTLLHSRPYAIDCFSTIFIHLCARSVLSTSAISLLLSHQVLVRVHGEISLQGLLAAYSVHAWNGNRILPGYQADSQA